MDWNKFKQAQGKKSIEVDGNKITLKVELGMIDEYLEKQIEIAAIEDKKEAVKAAKAFLQYQTDFILRLIKYADPNVDDDVVKMFIEQNKKEVIKEVMIALKLQKREDFEAQETAKN